MPRIEKQIIGLKEELQEVRRKRWDSEKAFYELSEGHRCEAAILRSKVAECLQRGVDFQICKDVMDEKRSVDDSYNCLHFGHQVLLLAIIHQMEARNSLLKLVGKQCKEMVGSMDKEKVVVMENNKKIADEQMNELRIQQQKCVLDDSLAQQVVAQRLVIKKLKFLIAPPTLPPVNEIKGNHDSMSSGMSPLQDASSTKYWGGSSKNSASSFGRNMRCNVNSTKSFGLDDSDASGTPEPNYPSSEFVVVEESKLETMIDDIIQVDTPPKPRDWKLFLRGGSHE